MFCPRCGTNNPDPTIACTVCGQDLALAAPGLTPSPTPPASGVKVAARQNSRPMAATMLGVAHPGQGNQAPPLAASARTPGPPPSTFQAAPIAPHPHRRAETMLGVAMPAPGSVAPPTARVPGMSAPPGAAPPHRAASAPPSATPSTTRRPQVGTMLGIPGPAPGSHAPTAVQSSTDARELASPRARLAELVRAQGPAWVHPSADLEAALLAAYRADVALLVLAQRAGVAQELLAPIPPEGWSERLDQLASRLIMSQKMKADDARYAIESWALALGVIAPAPLASVASASGPGAGAGPASAGGATSGGAAPAR